MASPSTPTHGKLGNIYRLRPNGFLGTGLNDLTWGTAATNAATALYEVEIDANGTPDTFQWRKNGGAYTTGVAITGAAQTLDEGQTITFAATTGHTIGDEWTWGNLKNEATTEAGTEAQITTAANRRLNPNYPPTWTDDGGETVQQVDFTTGTGYFPANVGNVTVTGNGALIDPNSLQQVGFFQDWSLDVSMDMADVSRQGQHWKEAIPGQAGATGSIGKLFIGTKSFMDAITEQAGGDEYFLLELFNYDPDQDQTGDHFRVWATINSLGVPTSVAEVVKETVGFQVHGIMSFTANS